MLQGLSASPIMQRKDLLPRMPLRVTGQGRLFITRAGTAGLVLLLVRETFQGALVSSPRIRAVLLSPVRYSELSQWVLGLLGVVAGLEREQGLWVLWRKTKNSF